MSVAILKQTYDEVRRLSIAGSVVAANDFRLKKLAAPLEQVGQKAPVFLKVAQAVTRLVEATEQESAAALLELSTLVNAILYTQGETGAAGEITPIATTDLGQHQTRASARVLKPLIEALSTTGSGRMEIIKDAHERGAFRDLRLVAPALAALDDSYSEIADFMADQVLPLYGRAIVPELMNKFDLKGRGGHALRLLLMYRLDPEGTRATVKRSLDEGSKEIRVVAIECLGNSPEDLAFLLEQSKSKAKDVRTAALRGLSKCDAPEAVDMLRAAFKTGNVESAVAAIAATPSTRLAALVLDELKSQCSAFVSSKENDKAEISKQAARLMVLLECLRGRNDRGAEQFLIAMFDDREKLAAIKGEPGGKDIEQRLVSIMAMGPREAQGALVDAHSTLSEEELADVFSAACHSRMPAQVFDLFSPYITGKFHFGKKRRDVATLKRVAIATALVNEVQRFRYELAKAGRPESDVATRLDSRWLDLAAKEEHMDLVQVLAVPGHRGANKLLESVFNTQLKKSKDAWELSSLLHTMVRVRHPAATDALVSTITKHAKGIRGYYLYNISPLIAELPKDAAPKLEAMLPGLPEKVVDQLLDYIAELKNRP
jgi:hypothetical protein